MRQQLDSAIWFNPAQTSLAFSSATRTAFGSALARSQTRRLHTEGANSPYRSCAVILIVGKALSSQSLSLRYVGIIAQNLLRFT